jgi:hypothetical protein
MVLRAQLMGTSYDSQRYARECPDADCMGCVKEGPNRRHSLQLTRIHDETKPSQDTMHALIHRYEKRGKLAYVESYAGARDIRVKAGESRLWGRAKYDA